MTEKNNKNYFNTLFAICFYTIMLIAPQALADSSSCGTSVECYEKALKLFNEARNEMKQLSNLQKIIPPIGAIISYIGPIDKIAGVSYASGMDNWVLCDGSTLDEGSYDSSLKYLDSDPKLGFQIPNLLNKFTKYVPINNVGSTGGKEKHQLNLQHFHKIEPCNDANGHNGLLAQSWNEDNRTSCPPCCNERSKGQTDDKLQNITLDNEPIYYGLLPIIRIR